jgi:hypothetical protein
MMEETPIKYFLKKNIEKINDENLLMAIYTILSSGRQDDNYEFEVSDERLAMLKERESKFLRGEDKAHTLKQVKDKIQAKYGF